MPECDPTYGRHIVDVGDELDGDSALYYEGTVTCLAELANDGPVLEFGIGTGGWRCHWQNGTLRYTARRHRLSWWPCSGTPPVVQFMYTTWPCTLPSYISPTEAYVCSRSRPTTGTRGPLSPISLNST